MFLEPTLTEYNSLSAFERQIRKLQKIDLGLDIAKCGCCTIEGRKLVSCNSNSEGLIEALTKVQGQLKLIPALVRSWIEMRKALLDICDRRHPSCEYSPVNIARRALENVKRGGGQ
jgi:hypothetical protein